MYKPPSQMLDLIKQFEGCRLEKYTDLTGNATIGWGHKICLYDNIPDLITQEEADKILNQDASLALSFAHQNINRFDLNDNQWSALGDFVFNLGVGALQSSTLRMVINRGDFEDAPHQFVRWCYAGTIKEPGLVARRQAEVELFTSPL